MHQSEQWINELQPKISGRVNDASDGEYREAVNIDNGRIAHEPAIVVVPQSISDIQTTIDFCHKIKERGIDLRLTTKAGGHSAAGYCLNTGHVVLDMRRLNAIDFNRKTGILKAGLGCRWVEVYEYLHVQRTGRIPVGGGCPTVGMAGFLLGGGFSFLSRSYGLGCDHITDLSIITADSKLHHLKSNQGDDLFWACCGGGGGNFGVAVEVSIQTQRPRRETMLMGEITFPLYQIEELLDFYNDWSQTLPNEMAVYGRIAMAPDARAGGKRAWSLLFTPIFNGDYAEGVALLQPLLELNPVRSDLHRMTIAEWEHFIGSRTSVAGRSAYMRSLVVPAGAFNAKAARVLKDYFAFCPSSDSFMVWTQTGGAIGDRKPTDTAYPHRDAAFVPEVKAIWETAQPQNMRANIEWAYHFYEELGRAMNATGAYLNYIDPLLNNWKTKYYGQNAARLKAIKGRVDPGGFFSFQQSVDSTFDPPLNRAPKGAASQKKPLDLSPLRRTFL
jgi:FAD/FMN-containing dehydrogenase